ncbi:MAG: DUF4340 domain-containing protein [Verrucomicrobiota bacterium]|nr:DUF4340 domain-containing protein [Verrucomicrobiota bacterium]
MNPKEFKWLSILAALLAAVCLYDYLLTPTDLELNKSERLFPKLDKDAIDSFTVIRGQNIIVAAKTNSQWRVSNPDYPAHPERIKRLAKLLAELTVSQHIAEADWTETGNEETFGLIDSTKALVRWRIGEKEQSIEVGALALFGRQTYVRFPGTRDVVLVDNDLANWVPRTTNDWRDLRLIPEDLDFDSLRFWGQSRTVQLLKESNKIWRMKEPIETETDQSIILQIINRMQLSRIIEVAPEEPIKSEPDATVRLAKNGKILVELSFRKPKDSEDDKIWINHSSRGNVAIEDDGLLTLLRLPHDQFRNHTIFRRPIDEVTSFSVEATKKFSVNKQTDGSWQVTGSKTFPADTLLVNNMLTNIRNGQIIDFVKDNATDNDYKKNGLDKPWLNLAIDGESPSEGIWKKSISFGTFDNKQVVARLNSEPTIVSLPRVQAILLPKEEFQLRQRRLWTFATNQVAAVTITLKNKPTRMLRMPNATWRNNDNKPLDQIQSAMLEETVYRMGIMTAVEWIGEGNAAVKAAGIEGGVGQIVAEADTSNGEKKFTLAFGNKDPLGRTRVMTTHYGNPTLFTCPKEFSNIYTATIQSLGLTQP